MSKLHSPSTLQSIVALLLVVLSIVGCGGAPAASPTLTAPAATATATTEPPTAPTVPAATATAAPSVTATRSVVDRRLVTPAVAKQEMTLKSIEFTSQALAGNLLGDPATRTIYVLLPPGYDESNKRYPVVYALHGYNGHSNAMVSVLKLPFDKAYVAGEVQDMIMVFPDAYNRLGGSYYLDSPTTGGYETYIAQELVATIDANFRTLPRNASRGIIGCSMGGDGAAHLGLTHPDVFSVVAAVSAGYDWGEPGWKELGSGLKQAPKDVADVQLLPFWTQVGIALAAAAAPNPQNPPLYLDLPWTISGDDVQVVEMVVDRIAAADPRADARRYVKQPQRLTAFMLYHGTGDTTVPVEFARAYDKTLTELGIEHTLVEVNDNSHCGIDLMPVVRFMSEHLVGEETSK